MTRLSWGTSEFNLECVYTLPSVGTTPSAQMLECFSLLTEEGLDPLHGRVMLKGKRGSHETSVCRVRRHSDEQGVIPVCAYT